MDTEATKSANIHFAPQANKIEDGATCWRPLKDLKT